VVSPEVEQLIAMAHPLFDFNERLVKTLSEQRVAQETIIDELMPTIQRLKRLDTSCQDRVEDLLEIVGKLVAFLEDQRASRQAILDDLHNTLS